MLPLPGAGEALIAIAQDMVEPYPVEKSAYFKDLIGEAQEVAGPAPFFQVVGLAMVARDRPTTSAPS